ncbi:MAG: hypothetical protein JJT75_04510 [Opitutales bacterium]|nr:hypothetical protein [Opitutales bacterium]MCH8540689.1 hypothetical protein [Opitutales bacterium]
MRLSFYAGLLFLFLSSSLVHGEEETKGSPEEEEISKFDEPVPRELVVDLLQQWFSLPPEDTVHWDKAVAEGRISRQLQLFAKELHGFHEIDHENVQPPVEVTLPNGEVVHGIRPEDLGPNLGANLTQEDLNQLMPDVIAAAEAYKKYVLQKYGDHSPDTRMHFEEGDLEFVLAYQEERPETRPFEVERPFSNSRVYYLEKKSFLQGGHIFRGRKSPVSENDFAFHLDLTSEGREILARVTRDNRPGHMAILFQGEVLSVPSFREELDTSRIQVTGLEQEKIRKILTQGNQGFFRFRQKREE